MIAHQDYELAEQFMNMDMSFCLNEDGSMKDGKTVGKHLFQMEGIFLDLTDRTLSHPKVPFSHEDRVGKFANIVKEAGLGNRKVIWRPSELFDLDSYMDAEWFPEQLLMYHLEYKELQDAKDLYCERSISFLDNFFKRLDVYRA